MIEYKTKTICEALEGIESSQWILPAFQRKYVWTQGQICNFFDSIMRGYPINTFMIWNVEKETARKHVFYRFIQDYREFWRETGEKNSTFIKDRYYAVIDGQQRINSLYIGYAGSYAVKLKNKRWKTSYDESVQPKTCLYLNLFEDADGETSRLYDFRFFSDAALNGEENKGKWFKVCDILRLKGVAPEAADENFPELVEEKTLLPDCSEGQKEVALKKLKTLYEITFRAPVINYYEEQEQELDKVVDVFLRSNGGGTPLAFSDLVMSVTTSQWPDCRDKFDELIRLIQTEASISLNKDFILKVFLVLYSNDVAFKVKNFEDDEFSLVKKAKHNFDKISATISGVCRYANRIDLDNETLRSKYALIPIIYFCYKNDFEIDNVARGEKNKRLIEIWLKTALLKGMFGGKPDSVLTAIRKIIDGACREFPTKEIINAFRNKSKDVTITRDFIEDKVKGAHYNSAEAHILLSLATRLDPSQRYNVDHMYPRSMFRKTELEKIPRLRSDEKLREFYLDKENWDTVGNLQLLNDSENKSKGGTGLSAWTKAVSRYKWSDYFIPKDEEGNLIVEDDRFKEFVEKRRVLIVDAIMSALTI